MININLVPTEIKEKIKNSRKTADTFSLAFVIVIIFVVTAVLVQAANMTLFGPSLQGLKDQLSQSSVNISSLKQTQQYALIINNRAKLAAQVEEKRPDWQTIIQSLIGSVPQNIQFESLKTDTTQTPNFTITATTDSEENIVSFKQKLEDSPYFKNVTFKTSSAQVKTTDKTSQVRFAFSLEFDLENLTTAKDNNE